MMALKARIAELIAAQGPISVAQFMALALHDPQEGYYATRDPLGRDFTTSPEISQMFGELLGLWCAQAWADQGSPKKLRLVELGPGRGSLMADALRALKRIPAFLAGAEIVLIEASPVLREMQERRLSASGVTITWKSRFDEALADRPLFLLANEFFDALPIRQYVRKGGRWHERMVVAKKGELAFALAPIATPPAAVPTARADAPEGGIFEIAPSALSLMEEIGRIIAAQGGAALVLDYGYGETAGHGETLQAIAGGGFADPLAEPGTADLSAHVDFAALTEAARRGGAAPFGPVAQGAFLSALGLCARAAQLAKANPAEASAIHAAAQRLIGESAMGRLFQALSVLPPEAAPPSGFAL
jgi:SAM-dependent MidA family methyltransferase